MLRLVFAFTLVAGLHAAAGALPSGPAAAADAVGASKSGVMHAQLVVQGPQAGTRRDASGGSVRPASLVTAPGQAAPAPQPDRDHPQPLALLLVGVALMTGIALRRWGAGRP